MMLRVKVNFPSDSPRTWPIWSGYRPAAWFGHYLKGRRHYHDCTLALESGDVVSPGNIAFATLSPMWPKYWKAVKPGLLIELSEGPIVVATAEVLAVEESDP